MILINSIDELEHYFAFPFIYQQDDKQLRIATITLFDIIQGTSSSITILPKSTPNTIVDPVCTFAKLYEIVDTAYKKNVKQFLEQFFFNCNIYKDSFIKCTIDFSFKSKSTMQESNTTIQKYIVLPTIDKASRTKKISNCSIQYNKGTATIIFGINNSTITNYEVTTAIESTYSDIDIYSNTYVKDNYIERNIFISNYEMNKIIVFCIYTETITKQKTIEYFIFDKQTTLLPTIKYIPKNHTVDSSNKQFDFSLNISCPVFNGIQYVDYSSLFASHGIALSLAGEQQIVNNSKFYINKNIVKQ